MVGKKEEKNAKKGLTRDEFVVYNTEALRERAARE